LKTSVFIIIIYSDGCAALRIPTKEIIRCNAHMAIRPLSYPQPFSTHPTRLRETTHANTVF
jgi:hypothetical protein